MTQPSVDNQVQMLLFIFAGMAWCGVTLLFLAIWKGFHHLLRKEPKPTGEKHVHGK